MTPFAAPFRTAARAGCAARPGSATMVAESRLWRLPT